MTIKASIRDTMTSVAEADLMGWATDLINNAGVQNLDDGDCEVTENGSGADNTVDIAVGIFYVEKSSFTKNSKIPKYIRGKITETENVTITPNTSGNSRIDVVCVKYLDAASPTSGDGEGVFEIHVEEGTPDPSPTAPATPNDCEALAQIDVADGATSITNANITDVRRNITINPKNLEKGLELLNDNYIKALDSTNVLRNLLGVDGSDITQLGDSNLGILNINQTVTNNQQYTVKAKRTVAQSIPSSVFTRVDFTNEDFDIGNMHNNGSNPSRITIPNDGAGLYLFNAFINFDNSSVGDRIIRFYKNGVSLGDGYVRRPASNSNDQMISMIIEQVSASDYYEVFVWQNSAGALNIDPAFFSAVKLA